jgi:hypothetical protein
MCSTQVGSDLTLKHQTSLERFAKDKHCSLLRTFQNSGRKSIYGIGPGVSKVKSVAPLGQAHK